MMLSYNPAEAKADNSVVFKQFQANHDLFSTAAPPPASTRQTRRQMNERRQTITTPSTSAPPLSRSPAKRKAKKALNTEEIINIIASSRSDKSRKGKEKEEEPLAAPPNAQEPMASVSTPIVEESLKTGAVRRRVRLQGSPLAPATADVRSASESFPVPIEPPSIMDQPPGVDESISFAPPKRVNGKRRRDPSPPPGTNDRENVPAPVPVPSTPGSPRKVSVSYPRLPDESMLIPPHVSFKMSNIAPPPPPPPQPPPPAPKLAVPPSPPKSTIKRIKLIVRRPPPTISHPDQRRPQHKHKSLTAFLSSYTLLDDEDVDPAALAQEAREEAEIIERVAQLRHKGRYIPDSDFLFGAIDEDYVLGGPLRETRDLWDDVVDEIVAVARKRSRQPTPKTLGNHIASILQKEWASSKARNAEEDKKKSPQEELAKAAIDAVIAEWKKAVHHIHEKRRLEEAEEERRLSHAHLDAMLDQSGYLLATQHTDLARGDRFRSRSRSGSLVEFEEDEEEDSDDEEDEEEQEVAEESVEGTRADDSATEQGEGDEDGKSTISSLHDAEDREDESTTMLLGAFSPRTTAVSSAGATRSGTPATTTTDTYPEQDYGAPTAQLLNGHANVAQDEDIEMRSDTSSDLDLDDLVNPLPDSSPIRTTPLSASCLPPPTTASPLPPPPTGSTLVPSDTPSPRAAEFYPKSVFSLSESVHKDVDVDTPRHPQSASRSITPNRRSATDSTLISRRVQASSIPEEETERAANLVDHEEVMDAIDDTANPYDGDQAMVEPSEQEDEEHDADDVEENQDQEQSEGGDDMDGSSIPEYLKPYAVAPVNWDPDSKSSCQQAQWYSG
ncbi:hypothetical protein NLJ89_g4701 [Agrocybe chaxingu]|uniref:Uncharacterized protein n=1 Tax=Agrocybe chaxingu TaxID=84603 RepID=A0A9W8K2R5_9AGAR|nr:hypothetical protein NLJ89_g4701 [Agrocybe chaxingu]